VLMPWGSSDVFGSDKTSLNRQNDIWDDKGWKSNIKKPDAQYKNMDLPPLDVDPLCRQTNFLFGLWVFKDLIGYPIVVRIIWELCSELEEEEEEEGKKGSEGSVLIMRGSVEGKKTCCIHSAKRERERKSRRGSKVLSTWGKQRSQQEGSNGSDRESESQVLLRGDS
jgi:hypothetical protein